jgi:diguanylate cyclase (GGDEF)-like protein
MLNKKNILIIEDDKDSRELLKIYLTKWGYNVFSSFTGNNVTETIQKENIQFALIDWVLNESSGIEICKLIRKEFTDRYIYIIIITGKKTKDDVIEALSEGADDYLMKPFNFEELKVRLKSGERVIRHHNLLKNSYEVLYKESRLDPLTRIFNRKTILEKLYNEFERAVRAGDELSVIMCDIDLFKKINDTYGHLTGDAVLKEIGKILNMSLRKYDSAGRYGGEEFLLILPHTNISTAESVAVRIKETLNQSPLKIDNFSVKVTMSFGISCSCGIKEMSKLIENADRALYSAKNSGRNNIVSFHSEQKPKCYQVINGKIN